MARSNSGARDIEPKSEGQRMFLEEEGSESELAAKLGCGNAIIGHWRRGRRLPGGPQRYKLELLFGIPRKSWDVVPGTELNEPKKSIDSISGNDDTLTITKKQIDSVLSELTESNLTDQAAAKLRDTVAKLLALRARLERDQELLEDRIVRNHPAWFRLKTIMLKSLEPFPDAAASVADALAEDERENS